MQGSPGSKYMESLQNRLESDQQSTKVREGRRWGEGGGEGRGEGGVREGKRRTTARWQMDDRMQAHT